MGWTFSSPETLARLRLPVEDPRRAGAVAIENPLSEEQSLLRTMLLGSLLDVAAHNVAHGVLDLRLFEVGTVFAKTAAEAPAEHRALGVLLPGRVAPPTWRTPDPPSADLFAVKGVLEALAAALRVCVECRPEPERNPFLHPGRAAEILVGSEPVGWLGELHPEVARPGSVRGRP